ncbi:MAG: hypothetical protein ACT4OO_15005 [Nitrospiraceae bacterium]
MRLQTRLVTATMAGATAVVYLALVGLAASCLFMHAAPSGEHDHHAQHSAHSPLCAWACQATSSVALISEPHVATAWLTECGLLVAPFALSSRLTTDRIRARAPPRLALS